MIRRLSRPDGRAWVESAPTSPPSPSAARTSRVASGQRAWERARPMSENIVIKIPKSTLRGLLCGLLLAPGVLIASQVTIPNMFTSGTPISSAQVNANFTALADANNDNDVRITAIEGRPQCFWQVEAPGVSDHAQVFCSS